MKSCENCFKQKKNSEFLMLSLFDSKTCKACIDKRLSYKKALPIDLEKISRLLIGEKLRKRQKIVAKTYHRTPFGFHRTPGLS